MNTALCHAYCLLDLTHKLCLYDSVNSLMDRTRRRPCTLCLIPTKPQAACFCAHTLCDLRPRGRCTRSRMAWSVSGPFCAAKTPAVQLCTGRH